MGKTNNSIDWSEKCWRDMLVYQRKSLWLEDTLDKLAAWMNLYQGMTAVDVGCGLGYLGYTYWKYFGEGGHYIGVDSNLHNLMDASQAAKAWAAGGNAEFINASAYRLPFPNDFADWVMCQVVMIHLDEPEQALAEMVRVVKPGGLVMCKEPDNLSATLMQHCWSLPDFDIETQLLLKKIHLISNLGRIKLGLGDASFGRKIPHVLKTLGLTDIDIRNNDKVHFVEPPYDTPMMKIAVARLEKDVLDDKRRDKISAWEREQFVAGGGDPAEYDHMMKISDEVVREIKTQLEQGRYYACAGSSFFVIKGRKPRNRDAGIE